MEDNVNHPQHYMKGFASVAPECIDITRYLPFALGNAFKYVWRVGKKGGKEKAQEDLQKASWYVNEWAMQIAHDAAPTSGGMMAARAVFGLLIKPKEDLLEKARYVALDRLLADDFDMLEVEVALGQMRKAIEHVQC